MRKQLAFASNSRPAEGRFNCPGFLRELGDYCVALILRNFIIFWAKWNGLIAGVTSFGEIKSVKAFPLYDLLSHYF